MSTSHGAGPRSLHESAWRGTAGRTDLGRRLAARRAAVGMSREELGERCGSNAYYISHLEEHVAAPTIAMLVRLADALGTTVDDLAGMEAGQVPEPPARPLRGQSVTLDEGECRRLLGARGIGRIAVFTPEGPAVHPVNYLVADGDIVFRTAADTLLARAAGTEAAFEVEGIDEVASRGWSVLAVGELRNALANARELDRLAAAAHSVPWAGGVRTRWMRLTPVRLTGRRVLSR
ncbi:helix-turn-helix domain-containing protein [Streptomyces sp. DSM 40907]|uniref:helix-turn-helix domain-containing protein n=1 Tax=Streptomyces kutzneri TaxID=3051179 RepID=UPI0028D45F6A|nr:pyridoxamine 5'-phosphate oxidase family protein [Streptomyces sp. DSM 40907]